MTKTSAASELEEADVVDFVGEFLAKIGMGDADEEFGSLPKRLTVEVDGPEFGDDVVDVASGGDYARAFA